KGERQAFTSEVAHAGVVRGHDLADRLVRVHAALPETPALALVDEGAVEGRVQLDVGHHVRDQRFDLPADDLHDLLQHLGSRRVGDVGNAVLPAGDVEAA